MQPAAEMNSAFISCDFVYCCAEAFSTLDPILFSAEWQLTRAQCLYLLYTAPLAAPKNLTFELKDQQLTLSWALLEEAELRGRLLAYKVQWSQGGESQVQYYSVIS